MPDLLLQRKPEPALDIVEGLIGPGELGILTGKCTIGKSPILLQLALCIHNGIPFLGRACLKRPVILIDFETNHIKFGINAQNLATRFKLTLPPNLTTGLEIYLKNGHPSDDSTKTLEAVMRSLIRTKFLAERLAQNPNALIIIDPIELFLTMDKNRGREVTQRYNDLRDILVTFPLASLLMTFNLRKTNKILEKISLYYNPNDWLEEVSGSLDILNRCDIRLGLDLWDLKREDLDTKVLSGIRRGDILSPIVFESIGSGETGYFGFERLSSTRLEISNHFTSKEWQHWLKIPKNFRYSEVETVLVPSGPFYRIVKKALSHGFLRKLENGSYQKVE